jgi:hypothetical protein
LTSILLKVAAGELRGEMSFETISLLLNWLQLGALLVIMFRLAHTFDLIANTQRELRRAIHHLGERRAAELGLDDAFVGPKSAPAARLPRFRPEPGSCS